MQTAQDMPVNGRSGRRSAIRRSRILIVEDDDAVRRLLEAVLRREGFSHVVSTRDARAVSRLREAYAPDLILLDLHLPHHDGFRVMAELEAQLADDEYLPVLVITGDDSHATRQRALRAGARDFLPKPFDPLEMLLRVENLLETRLLHRRLAEENAELGRAVARRTHELEVAEVEILERLAQAVEVYDDATGRHTRRVGELSAKIATHLGQPRREVELLRRAAPLHDVGKVGIPDSILLKPGPLTPEEFDTVKTHTLIGARILSGGTSDLIRMAEQVALSHHERWDGGGYPQGLAAEEIPLVARVVALADFCDAVGTDRPYRPAWEPQRIHETVRSQAGLHFDPAVVDAYFAMAQG